ncbi:MAG TPA: fluoride efflux transporter CrcB [Mycobacteriales bacterium]|nr:fluoride efflux transporter CrcB [Mycobacteriales bacterium]
MILALVVGVVAGIGAVARYVVDQVVSHRYPSTWPWGTFVINVTGSFVLGLVTGLATHHGLSTNASVVLGTGFAGGYTTWSTLMLEATTFADDGHHIHATITVATSLVAGLTAAAIGLSLALI